MSCFFQFSRQPENTEQGYVLIETTDIKKKWQ